MAVAYRWDQCFIPHGTGARERCLRPERGFWGVRLLRVKIDRLRCHRGGDTGCVRRSGIRRLLAAGPSARVEGDPQPASHAPQRGANGLLLKTFA